MVAGTVHVWSCTKFVTSCVGMSSMEVTPWRTERRRSLSGSLKVWPSGRATFIPGSTSLEQLSFAVLDACFHEN